MTTHCTNIPQVKYIFWIWQSMFTWQSKITQRLRQDFYAFHLHLQCSVVRVCILNYKHCFLTHRTCVSHVECISFYVDWCSTYSRSCCLVIQSDTSLYQEVLWSVFISVQQAKLFRHRKVNLMTRYQVNCNMRVFAWEMCTSYTEYTNKQAHTLV